MLDKAYWTLKNSIGLSLLDLGKECVPMALCPKNSLAFLFIDVTWKITPSNVHRHSYIHILILCERERERESSCSSS